MNKINKNIKEPKVLQLIDNLGFGGAESMAVNIANGLYKAGIFSCICTTHGGGANCEKILDGVKLFILYKKNSLDFFTFNKLLKIIRSEKINVVHAHSSSIFWALAAKIFIRNLKVVWHDHFGGRGSQVDKLGKYIASLSSGINWVIVVQKKLAIWAEHNLKVPKTKITHLINFAPEIPDEILPSIILPGEPGKRIILLANLRVEKGHIFLMDSLKKVFSAHPDWHLLLVGKNFEDNVSIQILDYIDKSEFRDNIHYQGGRTDVNQILQNVDISVLSSSYEGLPVVLLEYANHALPTVATNVGQCPEVINKFGLIVDYGDYAGYANAVNYLIENNEERLKLGKQFKKYVSENYSERSAVEKLTEIYNTILK